MATHTEIGDRIIGDTIICEAKQVKKKTSYSQNG